MGVTHLFYVNDSLAGYITIAMGAIRINETKLRLSFFDEKVRYPALLLGRVGVDNRFRKRNVGRCMCMWTIGFATELSKEIGCRFIVLLTKSQHRVDFYEKCGFDICELHKNKEEKLMYYQLF